MEEGYPRLHRSGRRPRCICGACGYCKQLEASRRSYRRWGKGGAVKKDGKERKPRAMKLEEKMVKFFKQRGWD